MTDKYTAERTTQHEAAYRQALIGTEECWEIQGFDDVVTLQCSGYTVSVILNALNHQSRAGSKTSEAKRLAAKANIEKRWASKRMPTADA